MSRKVSFVRESVYGGKRQSKSGNQSELDLTSSGQKSFFLLSEDFFRSIKYWKLSVSFHLSKEKRKLFCASFAERNLCLLIGLSRNSDTLFTIK